MNVVICTPARDTVTVGYASDLAELIRHNPSIRVAFAQGSILSQLRTTLASVAIAGGATHILFIDSDMRFPPDTPARLLHWDCPIVGATCQQRNGKGYSAWGLGLNIAPSTGSPVLEMVDSLGFGVTLIAAEVFVKLPLPWFAMPYDVELARHVGEDVYFCTKAREAGFSAWVDHDLSRLVKHAAVIER